MAVFSKPAATILVLLLHFIPLSSYAFDFSDVQQKAQQRAQRSYQPQTVKLDPSLKQLNFSEYHGIKPNMEHALWAKEGLPFKISFYPVGMLFDRYVNIHYLEGKKAHPITFDRKYFQYPEAYKNAVESSIQSFAGFRVHYPVNGKEFALDELASFLGASYFRLVGEDQRYGTSARGLAIDTALPTGEEFPYFTDYWITRPGPNDRHLTIFALMDSPSASGAFRFIIHPGVNTIVEVKSRIYMRKAVQKLGIAPLTSMFFYGTNQSPEQVGLRPEIHDADGLSILKGNGDWIWRPLRNPKRLGTSIFAMDSIQGFGLVQRGREFARYEDLVDVYESRPTVWVEPRSKWGKGFVELVEIPSPDETNDNIVTFWVPEKAPKKGEALDFSYNIHWTLQDSIVPRNHNLAYVQQTLLRPSESRDANLIRTPEDWVAFYIDFTFPPQDTKKGLIPFDPTKAEHPVEASVSITEPSSIKDLQVIPNPHRNGYRVQLKVHMADTKTPTEMTVFLKRQGNQVSETWSYQHFGQFR